MKETAVVSAEQSGHPCMEDERYVDETTLRRSACGVDEWGVGETGRPVSVTAVRAHLRRFCALICSGVFRYGRTSLTARDAEAHKAAADAIVQTCRLGNVRIEALSCLFHCGHGPMSKPLKCYGNGLLS